MKVCPNCHTKYTDHTLQFCLQDGAALEAEVPVTSKLDTVSLDETETLVSGRSPERINFDLAEARDESRQRESAFNGDSIQSQSRSSNTLLTILLTAAGMLILFAIVGIAAWVYFGQKQPEIVSNRQGADPDQSPGIDNSGTDAGPNTKPESSDNLYGPAPESTVKPVEKETPGPEPTETMPPVNADDIKKEVAREVLAWKSLAESRDLNGYMDRYADRIDYYSKRGAGKAFVERDKRKAFTTYTSIRTNITNLTVTPGADGKTATATFDKEWDFSNSSKRTTGKVRSQMVFRKTGAGWRIVSERDLKVYYVNR